jgi:hypothetical protein
MSPTKDERTRGSRGASSRRNFEKQPSHTTVTLAVNSRGLEPEDVVLLALAAGVAFTPVTLFVLGQRTSEFTVA